MKTFKFSIYLSSMTCGNMWVNYQATGTTAKNAFKVARNSCETEYPRHTITRVKVAEQV